MAKVIVIAKAILTRIIFGAHGFIAIWRVTAIKQDPYYWYLAASLLALTFEGVFTLTIKKNQEWKWFCPSVFLYLCSVVPAIWLLEVDKFDRKNREKAAAAAGLNHTVPVVPVIGEELPPLDTFGVDISIPMQLDSETWATVIEQLLMLILIIGRWMLPKGGLTRDQLSQLLLVYIGTAADIIEFFDSFKDDKISSQRVLCLLILSIWSWSLLQFTFVLTATKARKFRITNEIEPPIAKFKNGIIKVKEVCCSIDVWGILINIILQDAPFLIFRTLLITYYKIISYMNIFFTCKNTLVIILQFYRLFVVQMEKKKEMEKQMKNSTVSGNLAKAVERAAYIGPSADAKGRSRGAKKSSSGAQRKSKKHHSQNSISSQNMRAETSRKEMPKSGRRKSLSTGNLTNLCENEGETEFYDTDKVYEDDIEMGVSGSVVSGTNDIESQEDSDVANDDVSIASELPKNTRKNIRMCENPGVYKISGSRSSGASSERYQVQCRQDTGYSSSSKESANSSRRGRIVQHGGNSRTGRSSSSNRSRSTAQRRRNLVSSHNSSSLDYGDSESQPPLDRDTENERI